MKVFKKTLKIIALVFLIILASVGIGIGGSVPITSSNKKEDKIEIKIELFESPENKTDLKLFEAKK